MRAGIFFILFLFSVPLAAQEGSSQLDIRFGAGPSLLGSGDMLTTAMENELNYKVSKYFAAGLSVGYGRSNMGVFITASYLQGNLNAFFSPFKNTGRNDFRIGTGLSLFHVSDARLLSEWRDGSGNVIEVEYAFDERRSYGYNIILEDTYSIKSRYLVGLKLFTQSYFIGDLNSGLLVNFGVKL